MKVWPPLVALALLVGASLAAAQAPKPYLYLLAGTPGEDSSAGSPTTLYAVGRARSLVRIRGVFNSLFGVRDDLAGDIYVLGANFNTLSVLNKNRPSQVDLVPLYTKGLKDRGFSFMWSGWGPSTCGGVPCAIFPNRNPGITAPTLTTVLATPENARVGSGAWSLYSTFRFGGVPGSPEPAIGPLAKVTGGNVEMPDWRGTPAAIVARGVGRAGISDGDVFLDADTVRYMLLTPITHHGGPGPLAVYIERKADGYWRAISVEAANPRSQAPPLRLFGNWLATIVKEWAPAGMGPIPGQENERNVGARAGFSLLPNVRWDYNMQGRYYMPGILELDNLADRRRIMIDTGQQDSEVLDVSKSGQVLYRVNDEIFSAQIEGDKIGPSTLVVKGEDVPEVHWVFWSKAKPPGPPAKVPSGNPR